MSPARRLSFHNLKYADSTAHVAGIAMIHFTLKCANDHQFDSWFQSGTAYDRLAEADAALCTPDAAAIADALITLETAEQQARLGHAAQDPLDQATDPQGLTRAITRALYPCSPPPDPFPSIT